jgi:hypothetical protein
MNDNSIRAITSAGSECLWCDEDIRDGEQAILVIFKIPLIITSTTVEKQAHVRCAEELAALMALRIKQAKKRE